LSTKDAISDSSRGQGDAAGEVINKKLNSVVPKGKEALTAAKDAACELIDTLNIATIVHEGCKL